MMNTSAIRPRGNGRNQTCTENNINKRQLRDRITLLLSMMPSSELTVPERSNPPDRPTTKKWQNPQELFCFQPEAHHANAHLVVQPSKQPLSSSLHTPVFIPIITDSSPTPYFLGQNLPGLLRGRIRLNLLQIGSTSSILVLHPIRRSWYKKLLRL